LAVDNYVMFRPWGDPGIVMVVVVVVVVVAAVTAVVVVIHLVTYLPVIRAMWQSYVGFLF
jgi:hypothetical protein